MTPRPRGQSLEQQRERFDNLPLYRQLGLKLDEARPGFSRISMATSPLTLGGVGGSVHGGLLAMLIDVAMLEAMFPMFEPDDLPAGTADLNITYIRPALSPRSSQRRQSCARARRSQSPRYRFSMPKATSARRAAPSTCSGAEA
jgi:uncharacterized protein (TIGR00369 family)